ncbi:MAG TPA: hypothetical protein VHX88_16640 [Solirubrobacteraceae bacterium]|nr:hypothetical protein [Solirubrobacteraceae bacterium]
MSRVRARLIVLTLAAALAFGLQAAAGAQASVQQQSWFQDDNLLVYGTPSVQAKTLETLRGLGVDEIRVSVFWDIVAPASGLRKPPRFSAADPASYPAGSFNRYDTLVELAQRYGIAVNFDITSPAPRWATIGQSPRSDIQKNWNPSPSDFGQFVSALGTRYSGTYVPTGPRAPDVPDHKPLPRVSSWSIWNEPNQPGWLTPQYTGTVADPVPASPRIYRSLLDAGFAALLATGHIPAADHGKDTVLFGETAPEGDVLNSGIGPCSSRHTAELCTAAMKPVPFVQDLYCLSSEDQPLTGGAALALGCPSHFDAGQFMQDNPLLFVASGYAHHPYDLTLGPSVNLTDPDSVVITDLPTLTSLLAKVLGAYGVNRPLGMPLYLTEFGYITNPPNPLGVSFAEQAAYMNEAEFIAYNNPDVSAFSQFLLVDSAPKKGQANALAAYGGTFQTGLELANGDHKPAYDAYRLPVDVPTAHVSAPGGAIRVWGEVRAARLYDTNTVRILLRPRAHGKDVPAYRTLRTIVLHRGQRFFDNFVSIPFSGLLALSWKPTPDSPRPVESRLVPITVG